MAKELKNSPSAKAIDEALDPGLKNFRHSPDVENFYKFVHKNDLRFEALAVIDGILADRQKRQQTAAAKSKAH